MTEPGYMKTFLVCDFFFFFFRTCKLRFDVLLGDKTIAHRGLDLVRQFSNYADTKRGRGKGRGGGYSIDQLKQVCSGL